MPRRSAASRLLSGIAAFASVGAAAWILRHFTAPAVRAWRAGRGELLRAGSLAVRTTGSGDRVFVLLHGLAASGDTFGDEFDRVTHCGRLLVPDLLGFGHSMDAERQSFSLNEHLESLDAMLGALGLANARLVIGGHSLGGLLALHWAARQRAQVEAVVTWGGTLFRNQQETRARLQAMGPLERLFALDSPLAEKSCALMCRYRRTAQWLAVALSPDLPVTISRRAVRHTWPAYRGAVSMFFSDWHIALRELDESRVPVTIVAGSNDPSQVPGLAEDLPRRFSNVRAIVVPKATHILPIQDPKLCVEQLLGSSGC